MLDLFGVLALCFSQNLGQIDRCLPERKSDELDVFISRFPVGALQPTEHFLMLVGKELSWLLNAGSTEAPVKAHAKGI